jgi:hypothetical protein
MARNIQKGLKVEGNLYEYFQMGDLQQRQFTNWESEEEELPVPVPETAMPESTVLCWPSAGPPPPPEAI